MTESIATPGFPSPRLLRVAAIGALTLLFILLTLGAVVTSFHVGMADPIWPTRPWHLLTISWEEPSTGFLIEHTHRLAGFVVGLAVTTLAILFWLTESRKLLRWGGLVSIIALIAAFMGHLHGTLIAFQKQFQATGDLTPPDWTTVLGPTLAALGLTVIFAVWSATTGPGGGFRLLGLVLLIAVMAQGILGGLRVYLNALYGSDLAAIHGVFSQIVLGLAVFAVVLTGPRRSGRPGSDLLRWSFITAFVVFGQIIAGAILRHSASPLGPRLHLLGAFLVVFATAAVSRRSRGTGVRGLAVLAASLAGLQVLVGVEAWMIRFKAGLDLLATRQVTEADAIVRTLHALIGYGLFATVIGLVAVLLRDREPVLRPAAVRRPADSVEVLV
jgi:cytochrome c oxidase assembly protein subunit 15